VENTGQFFLISFVIREGTEQGGSYIHRFEDTVGDWLIGFEIVLLFLFRIEDSLPSFFRFGETVACMIRSILYEAILPPG